MNVLIYGLSLAAFAFLLHLIIWKIRLPKNQVRALAMVFSFILILGVFFLMKFPGIIKWSILPGKNLFEAAQFFLLFISIAAAYIVSYPAIEADSPTLVIVKAVSDAGPGGLEEGELGRIANDGLLIMPRIKDMLSGGMVYFDGKKYKLLPKGAIMARVFLFYRGLIKSAKGG